MLFFVAQAAYAHPMGTKLFGHRMLVKAEPENLKITYIVEIPTSKLVRMMNRYKVKHGLQIIGPEEEVAFNNDMQEYLLSNIDLHINGRSRKLSRDPNYAASQGAGDYRFFEYRLHLIASIDDIDDEYVRFRLSNDNFRMQRAVYYDEIKHLPGIRVIDSNIPVHTGWMDDSQYRVLKATLQRGEFAASESDHTGVEPVGKAEGGALLDVLKGSDLSPDVILAAFLTALFLGAVHALSPGHGKALVAAYLVGSRGTVGHAVWLSLIVTFTHILSVVVVGLVALVAAQYVVPEYYMPFISLASGLIIIAIGIWLIVTRIKRRRPKKEKDHHHPSGKVGWRTLLALGITGGIVPCPSAMVVMLTAIAIGRIAFGLSIIVFFSLGLAVSLIIVGILAVKTSHILDRFARANVLTRWLPLASAIVITLLGCAIIYRGFWVEWF